MCNARTASRSSIRRVLRGIVDAPPATFREVRSRDRESANETELRLVRANESCCFESMRSLPLLSILVLAHCSSTSATPDAGSPSDGGAPLDAPSESAAPEAGPTDSGPIDAPSDGNTVACGTIKPDGTNSGVGILAPAPTTMHAGTYTVTTSGTTVKDLIVTGQIIVDADDVTVENCEVLLQGIPATDNKDTWGIYVKKGHSNVVVHYNTVHSTSPNQNTNAYGIGIATWEHNEAYDVVDGFDPQEAGFVFCGNYVHDLFVGPVDSSIHSDLRTHSDGIELEGGGGSILGNTLVATSSTKSTYTADGPTSAIMFPGDAAIPKISATKNWLSYGDITINMGSVNNSTTTGTVSDNVITSPAAPNTAFVKNNDATGCTATGNVDGNNVPITINYVNN
jgi:hypothetical protein